MVWLDVLYRGNKNRRHWFSKWEVQRNREDKSKKKNKKNAEIKKEEESEGYREKGRKREDKNRKRKKKAQKPGEAKAKPGQNKITSWLLRLFAFVDVVCICAPNGSYSSYMQVTRAHIHTNGHTRHTSKQMHTKRMRTLTSTITVLKIKRAGIRENDTSTHAHKLLDFPPFLEVFYNC